MLKRCESLDIGSEQSLRGLWVGLSSRGWRNNEPLDDEIGPEPPQALRNSIRYLNDNGILSGTLLGELCALPAKDIEELAGLDRGTIDVTVQQKVTVISSRPEGERSRRTLSAEVVTFPTKKAR
jgi:hypothetical protein